MKAAIIYDSKNGMTEQICRWIKEGMSNSVDIIKAGEVESLDYDLIIIGSPIYFGNPLKSVMTLIKNRSNDLANKKIAAFIVYLIKEKIEVGRSGFAGCEDMLAKFIELLPVEPIATEMFMGKLDVDDLDAQSQMVIGRILQMTQLSLDDIVTATRKDCMAFGEKINSLLN